MSINRRNFLRSAGFLASGVALTGVACNAAGNKDSENAKSDSAGLKPAAPVLVPLSSFGLQLYSLRDDLPRDPKGILKQVAGFGYKEIEGYEGDKGMFWGMSHTDFKKYMDELGMVMVSSHCDIHKDFEKKAAQAAEIGMKYLISPWIGPQKKADDYKKFADTFNQKGAICKQNGIRFAYHNHGYTFKETEGQMPQDILMQQTDPALVDFELDIYWVVTAGADPEAWFKKYPNRFSLCHFKDRIKGVDPKEEEASCDLGTGSIDYAKVLRVAADNGMKHFIMEQERYDNSTPLKSAEAGAAYLKKLLI
jgi:sugar phosphate isomerase/epimerase